MKIQIQCDCDHKQFQGYTESCLRKDVTLFRLAIFLKEDHLKQGYMYFTHQIEKKYHLIFISYFRNINCKLKHKPYLMTKIIKIILKSKGFK